MFNCEIHAILMNMYSAVCILRMLNVTSAYSLFKGVVYLSGKPERHTEVISLRAILK